MGRAKASSNTSQHQSEEHTRDAFKKMKEDFHSPERPNPQ